MNKLALICLLLGSVCLANATGDVPEFEEVELESQAAAPTDAEETANLKGDAVVFSDFCLRTRDHVLGDIKTTTNSVAANLFTTLFNSAQELGTEAMEAQKKATDRLGNQILNPEAQVENSADNEVDGVIAEGQRKIKQDPRQPRAFINAFISAIQATGTAIARGVANRIKNLENISGLDTAVAAVGSVCDRFTQYNLEFLRDFQETKAELAAENPKLASLSLGAVDCVTSKRVIRLEALCKLAKVARGPLMSLIRPAA